jgi:hypothetical protein
LRSDGFRATSPGPNFGPGKAAFALNRLVVETRHGL